MAWSGVRLVVVVCKVIFVSNPTSVVVMLGRVDVAVVVVTTF